ncbi:hypothetical protein AMECASPLE_009565, partial [Ameca splendens]
ARLFCRVHLQQPNSDHIVAGSCTGFDRWWHVGTCLDLCCLGEADTERENPQREREEAGGQLVPRMK